MRRTSNSPERRTLVAGTGLVTLLAFLMMTLTACSDSTSKQLTPSTSPPVSTVSGHGGGTYDVVIKVKMSDFAFTPDTLRIPAGQAVKLELENVGVVAHEFMAGRDVTSDGTTFQEDLFEGVDVELGMDMDMDMGEMNHEGMEEMEMGHGAGEEAEDHEDAEKADDHEHAEKADDHERAEKADDHERAEEADDHEHAGEPDDGDEADGHGGAGHGTMLLLQVDASGSMQFTLPESKRGMWSIGCFQPGHYQAGMKGILIVE